MENPSVPPITMYQNNKFQKLRIGLSPADIQILDRLEKLREDKNKVPPPSESEIRMRLANLKGQNPYVEGPVKMVSNKRIEYLNDRSIALLSSVLVEPLRYAYRSTKKRGALGAIFERKRNRISP